MSKRERSPEEERVSVCMREKEREERRKMRE